MIGILGFRRHARLRDLLSAYIDGQVSESETRRVETHLSQCEACSRELSTLRATVGLVRALPELPVPRSFTMAQAPVLAPSTPPIVWTARLATSAAAMLLVALLLGDVLGLVTQERAIEGLPLAPRAVPAPAPAPVAPSIEEERSLEAAAAPAPALAAPAAPAPAPAAPAPAPAPAAAMAAAPPPTEPDSGVEERRVAVTPEMEEAPPSAEAAEEPKVAAVQEAVAPTPERELMEAPLEPVRAAEDGAAKADEGEGGLVLPLWQLEVAVGGSFVLLGLASWWIARRARRPSWGTAD